MPSPSDSFSECNPDDCEICDIDTCDRRMREYNAYLKFRLGITLPFMHKGRFYNDRSEAVSKSSSNGIPVKGKSCAAMYACL